MRFAFTKITSLAVLIFIAPITGQKRQPCAVSRVMDSCRVELTSGEIVRLIGVESFPNNRSNLLDPISFLDSLVTGKALWLELDDNLPALSYRNFFYLWYDSLMINEELLRRGLVRFWMDTVQLQHRKNFLAVEREAKTAKRGNWETGVILEALSDTTTVVTATPEDTVYVTQSGRKYHRANCRLLSENKMALPLSKARLDYTPCRLCVIAATKPEKKTRDRKSDKIGVEQCQAITKSGARCKRQAEPGSKYCWQHRRK